LSNTNPPEIIEKSANQANENDNSLNEFILKKDEKRDVFLDSSPIIELSPQTKTDGKNQVIDLKDEDDDDCEIISWNVLSPLSTKNKSPIVKNEPNSPYKNRFNRSIKKTSYFE
jgi:hypothetical protein